MNFRVDVKTAFVADTKGALTPLRIAKIIVVKFRIPHNPGENIASEASILYPVSVFKIGVAHLHPYDGYQVNTRPGEVFKMDTFNQRILHVPHKNPPVNEVRQG